MTLNDIIGEAKERRASDLHFVAGLPIKIRVDNILRDYDSHILTHEECEEVARELCGERYSEISEIGEMDLARSFPCGIRCRINVFRQQGHVSSSLRLLFDDIPAIDTLGLPPIAWDFIKYRRGIVLVTGETGSGKTTTLAAILNEINHMYNKHIITLEDPIEYIYKPDKCTINQRQLGQDTTSYAKGIRAALREDPDVILVGEMRDRDTIETALTAAETGHLVFATLHTNSAPGSIDRIVNAFPADKHAQVRMELAGCLKAVISQHLIPRKDAPGRVLACEVMVPNGAMRNLIREGKDNQLYNSMLTGANDGNITMDNALLKLARTGAIAMEEAADAAQDTEFVKKSLGIR